MNNVPIGSYNIVPYLGECDFEVCNYGYLLKKTYI